MEAFLQKAYTFSREEIREKYYEPPFRSVVNCLETIKLLKPMESVKDRLSSFYYLSDKQGLEQACDICLEQQMFAGSGTWSLETWSLEGEQGQKFRIFEELVKKRSMGK